MIHIWGKGVIEATAAACAHLQLSGRLGQLPLLVCLAKGMDSGRTEDAWGWPHAWFGMVLWIPAADWRRSVFKNSPAGADSWAVVNPGDLVVRSQSGKPQDPERFFAGPISPPKRGRAWRGLGHLPGLLQTRPTPRM